MTDAKMGSQLWSTLEYEVIFPGLNRSLGWQQQLCCISLSVLTLLFWKCYHMGSKNSTLGVLPLPHEPQVHWGCGNLKSLCWAFHLLPSGDGKSRAKMPAGAARVLLSVQLRQSFTSCTEVQDWKNFRRVIQTN